jgi:hypothetical protein
MPNYFTAIIVNQVRNSSEPQFVKYRNIPGSKIAKLCKFTMGNFPGVHHINLYSKDTKKFFRQLNRSQIENPGELSGIFPK